jgi:hypothetical protein
MTNQTPKSDENSQSKSASKLPASVSEREAAGKIFIDRGKEAEAAGDLRQALIHYEDALYYLRSDPALENYLERLRKKAGDLMRKNWEELMRLEDELKKE